MTAPLSTYRLQIRGAMDLERAAALVPYLADLGISHLYASPLFAAAPGSSHGYDVADFRRIDPAIGGAEGFAALSEALRAHGLGLLLDFVPNHMGATPHNPWWRDVLEWGARSGCAEHFDIDWTAPKLIVPVLGEPYGAALAGGRLSLFFDRNDGGISLAYGELRLPLTPPSYARLLAAVDDEAFPELARRFAGAAPDTSEGLKAELARHAAEPAAAARLEAALAAAAADREALHALHEEQAWRLTYWRAARETLTYRRFFEIADLVGIRVERPRVFDDVHALLLGLIAEGRVDGVRLDHVDGLADPKAYIERLQAAIGGESPFYLLVEKILGPDEALRRDWPVAGTTGYEFIQALADLFVDAAGETAMTEAYHAHLGGAEDFAAMVRESKRRILSRNLAGELEFLKQLGCALAAQDPMTRDCGGDSLRRAILEFAAALPVYRTYVDVAGAEEADLALIAGAVEAAKASREVEDDNALDFLARLLRLDFDDPARQATALEFTARLQQTTGPVMAKALEDTVFYRYNRLVALNEVGGDPQRFGAPVAAFHAAMRQRLARQRRGLSATATHDTKRGEDARARLYGLAEMPRRWAEATARWRAMNAGLKMELADGPAPEPAMEWLFYQALLGAWPADLAADDGAGLAALSERLSAYMLKAVREAKLRTSWTAPDEAYEAAIDRFVAGTLAPGHGFAAEFSAACAPLVVAGAATALSQLAVKLAAPGVPDIYQGTEFWDLSLVDPDNRRPVDFAARGALLAAEAAAPPADPLAGWRSGAPKLRLLRAGLQLRRDRPALFAEGDYRPLEIVGSAAGHAVAFARAGGGGAVLLVATRLPLELLAGETRPLAPAARWGDTRLVLPADLAGGFAEILTGRRFAAAPALFLADLLAAFPAVILASDG